jgi:hypothetical protein
VEWIDRRGQDPVPKDDAPNGILTGDARDAIHEEQPASDAKARAARLADIRS